MKNGINIQKAASPFFLLSVVVLLLNDLVLKEAYGNAFTGKLSDVAGLFMFPFLLSIFSGRTVLLNYILTAVLFIWWKSPASNALLQFSNDIGFPMHRVVDYTDLWALLVLPLSHYAYIRTVSVWFSKKLLQYVIVSVALFGTVATTKAKRYAVHIGNINKTYPFSIPLSSLAAQFNALQLKYIDKYRQGLPVQFDKKKGAFYVEYEAQYSDTIAQLVDYKHINPADTLFIKTSLGKIQLTGDDKQSSITLYSIAYLDYYSATREDLKGVEKNVAKSIHIFEKEIIHKIKNK